ncbi:MAG TPA: pyridine nucleotide-disulfide oxidoreductase [Nocardioides bacterium]|uniref:dihydrolipoyl dehydrogenase family protein n=1 Tax=uncultured Nocardioides sp. TaxID=198441 RepID=UPI000EBB8B5E|nr:NAD(P)/FAD-dependent oxidoreductase [uncultured Nocardioides sp.]HCB06570.1 pyridine nucleotide-disulfide oxidoreductase [Nocardioides sp.]
MTAAGSTRDCDVVVLGIGPGGEYAARKLALAGLDVVAVEEALVGGECPFWGCTPSKLMVRPGDLLAEVHRADRLAGDATVRPDWSLVAARIREANHDWTDHHHAEPLERDGVTIVRGHGRLDGPGVVRVEQDGISTVLRASRGVLLNTGTAPLRLSIDGLDATPYWTNREAMKVTEVPDRLVVVGAGPNGLELAQAFARYGARVTLLAAADRIAEKEEPEASAALAAVLRDEGIDVRVGVEVERVDHDGGFRVAVGDETLVAEALLVAAGRSNNLGDIGLETVGLDPQAPDVEVDERLRAGDRLWAIGDITGKGAFTHVSRYQAAGAVSDILGHDGPPADYRAVSRVTFTDPELAAVGMTEAEARGAGLRVRVGLAHVEKSARGWLHGPGTTGIVKVVEDADRGVLVGASVLSPYGGEVIGLLVTAVHGEVPVSRLRTMHYAYPTFHRSVEAALKRLE